MSVSRDSVPAPMVGCRVVPVALGPVARTGSMCCVDMSDISCLSLGVSVESSVVELRCIAWYFIPTFESKSGEVIAAGTVVIASGRKVFKFCIWTFVGRRVGMHGECTWAGAIVGVVSLWVSGMVLVQGVLTGDEGGGTCWFPPVQQAFGGDFVLVGSTMEVGKVVSSMVAIAVASALDLSSWSMEDAEWL